MICSWGNSDARQTFESRAPRGVPNTVLSRARRVLAQLNAAATLGDMAVRPGNQLPKLGGTEVWAVRVNQQYRITFTWGTGGPENVWLGDYH